MICYFYAKRPYYPPLKSHDVTFAEKLLLEYPEIFSQHDVTTYKKELLDYLALRQKDIHALTLKVDHNIAGVIVYHKDLYAHNAYQVTWFVIKKGLQNKGFGTKLLHEVFKRVRKLGGKHIYLETSNERHNEHAKKFYGTLGFKKVGVLPDYYDPPIKFPRKLEDGIIYHKALNKFVSSASNAVYKLRL